VKHWTKNDEIEKPERSFMKTKIVERDATLAAAYVGVAVSGGLLLVGSGSLFGVRAMAAVALGVVIAISNLWTLERFVRVYLASERGRWAGVAILKSAVLFALVALLVKSGAVDVLPLILGFGALPLGVVVAGLWPGLAVREGN
jgi:hypothetical protein